MESLNAIDIFCHWVPRDYGAAQISGALDAVNKLAISSVEREDVLHRNWARMLSRKPQTKEKNEHE